MMSEDHIRNKFHPGFTFKLKKDYIDLINEEEGYLIIDANELFIVLDNLSNGFHYVGMNSGYEERMGYRFAHNVVQS